MNNFNEFDTRKEAKKNSEYLTPLVLRNFLSSKIKGNNLSVLEPAIGSGQLLFNFIDKIQKIDGYDINKRALDIAKNNFKDKLEAYNKDFITSDINKKYDLAICNYPFSLRPSKEQKEYLRKDKFFSSFYKKDITGVLDFIFILKSFMMAKEGYYLAFPGIAYRNQEKKFRQFLIDNKYIKEYGIINNCKFEYTQISILYLHLTKSKNKITKSFSLDLKQNKLLEEETTLKTDVFAYPQENIKKEKINAVELEYKARKGIIEKLKKEIRFSRLVYDIDEKLKSSLPDVNDFIDDIIKTLKKEKTITAKNIREDNLLFKI